MVVVKRHAASGCFQEPRTEAQVPFHLVQGKSPDLFSGYRLAKPYSQESRAIKSIERRYITSCSVVCALASEEVRLR
jgi:hypothetical protein